MKENNLMGSVKAALEKIAQKKQIASDNEDNKKILSTPFVASQVVFNDRIRVLKALLILSLVALTIVSCFLASAKSTREIIAVPALPNVMKVRVGSLPDDFIYSFAEYVVRELGTFSYRSVERQYTALSELMAPEFKYRFLMEVSKKFKVFKELRVDEIFEQEPISKFEIINDKKGAKYRIVVKGATKKYIEGNLRETISEIFVIDCRTTPMAGNRPWLLQIESFRRSTPDEEDKLKRAADLQIYTKEKE